MSRVAIHLMATAVSPGALYRREQSRAPRTPPVQSGDSGAAWRNIGPFRGGRTKAAAGIPSQPNVFYIGAVNGGVWKTTDYGRTWTPIFDDQPTGSIGAIAIAPSNPDIIYVGSGEGLQRPDLSTGDGIYKSVRRRQQRGRTLVSGMVNRFRRSSSTRAIRTGCSSPCSATRTAPAKNAAIFRSTDGGQTFTKVLYKDADTGGADVVLDPVNPNIVYAVLWQARQAPWENGVFSGPGSGVFKSTDGGATWQPIMNGLPTFANDGLGAHRNHGRADHFRRVCLPPSRHEHGRSLPIRRCRRRPGIERPMTRE